MATRRTGLSLLLLALLIAPLAASLPASVLPGGPSVHEFPRSESARDPVNGAPIDASLLESFARGETQPVILVLDPSLESLVIGRLAALRLDHYLYNQLHMASVLADAETLPLIAHLPGVVSIHANEKMHPRLDQSAAYLGAPVVWKTYGATGRGVTVMVLDSGIDGNHPDLRYGETLVENVVPSRRTSGLVGGSKEGIISSDADGHGTHVAGIIAGSGDAQGGPGRADYVGVAHGAQLVGYQAGLIDKNGDVVFESLTVLEGFDWALENRHRYDIRVISNSWGANGEFDPRSPVNLATLNLYKAGILVVFAAGNEGDQGSHSLNKYAVPPWVLSVAAGDYLNQVPGFSSRGTDPDDSGLAYDHPDLVAPGLSITSTRPLKSARGESGPDRYYSAKSGSSMATPHVAGLAALLLETNPDLSPDDLMDVLTATATPMPRYDEWEAGAGYANGLKAYQLATKATGHRGEFMTGMVKYAGPASGDPQYARDAVSVGWLKGAAYRLRSPDLSAAEFVARLFTTMHGLVFLGGGLLLAPLAFGLGRPAPGFTPAPAVGPPPLPGRSAAEVGFTVARVISRPEGSRQWIRADGADLGRPAGKPPGAMASMSPEIPRIRAPAWESRQ